MLTKNNQLAIREDCHSATFAYKAEDIEETLGFLRELIRFNLSCEGWAEEGIKQFITDTVDQCFNTQETKGETKDGTRP